MNERKFLKLLNEKQNTNGKCTRSLVLKILLEQKQDLTVSKRNFFKKLFAKNKKVKSGYQIIEDNLDLILQKTPNNEITSILEYMINDNNANAIVRNNFFRILENIDDRISQNELFLEDFIMHGKDNHDFVMGNIEKIVENTSGNQLFYTIAFLRKNFPNEMSSEKMEFFNKKLEENKSEVAGSLLIRSLSEQFGFLEFQGIDVTHKKRETNEKYAAVVMTMIEELLKSENKKWIDIKHIGEGGFSNVFEIGDKVLKIGRPRNTYNIPNHRRILQPLIRTNLGETANEQFACIEITEKVDTDISMDSEEVLYQIYKDLRDDGIIWTDIRFANIGRLKSDNIPTLNNETMYVSPNSVGFDKENTEEPLKSGDFVILDSDFIYIEGDTQIRVLEKGRKNEFEKRYLQERVDSVHKKYMVKDYKDYQSIKSDREL